MRSYWIIAMRVFFYKRKRRTHRDKEEKAM